ELGTFRLGAFSPRELYRYIYQGSSTLLQTIQTDYTSGENTALPIRKTITLNDTNQVRKEEFDYDPYSMLTGQNPNPGVINKVIEHREFDYGSGAPGLLLRKTDTTWLKTNSINGVNYATTLHILDRKATEIVKDPSSNPIAQSQFEYDSYTEGLTASGAVQHNSVY